MADEHDVVVLGGGPAGAATALRLARLGRRAAMVERTNYERPRAGETFGGDIAPLLRDLGVWDEFARAIAAPFRGVHSAWGSPELHELASIFHPHGEGWHVDRGAFDRMLADSAARAGVRVLAGAGASGISRERGSWQVRAATGETITARFLVDASGRGAPATAPRMAARRWLQADREIALVSVMTAPPAGLEPVLLLESVEEGWWYSVPQREGALLAVLITDSDLLPARGPEALARYFDARLAATTHTAARAAGARLSGPPWIARADSGLLRPGSGDGWRAAGDAAFGGDPLGGDGVVRALRSAEEVARATHAELSGDAAAPTTVEERFCAHLTTRERYCSAERRWPDSVFWARRSPIDWRREQVVLDPRSILQLDGTTLSRSATAPAEALLTADGLQEAVRLLRTPTAAHDALRMLTALVPFEHRRLLIGLQLLQQLGAGSR